MEFKCVYLGSVSACFELDNARPYYAPEGYEVYLDGMKVLEGDTNVFSLYDLKPDQCCTVTVRMKECESSLTIRTRPETCAVSVRAFGAKGDGVTDDTAAIQRAICVLPEGGRLIVPEGTYLTGPIFLKSRMTLELRQGATLLGLTDKAAYPVLPAMADDLDGGERVHFGTFEGLARDMYAALITAEYARDIAIVGPGRVDGNAQNGDWWTTFRTDPVARPRLIFMNRCENVTLHGVDAANSASWQLHPYFSRNVSFYDVAVSAPKDSPNTDALDPECCDGTCKRCSATGKDGYGLMIDFANDLLAAAREARPDFRMYFVVWNSGYDRVGRYSAEWRKTSRTCASTSPSTLSRMRTTRSSASRRTRIRSDALPSELYPEKSHRRQSRNRKPAVFDRQSDRRAVREVPGCNTARRDPGLGRRDGAERHVPDGKRLKPAVLADTRPEAE